MYNFNQLYNLGISHDDAIALRRISMTLHRWYEMECGDDNGYASYCISRGKKTGKVFEYDDDGKPYLEMHPHSGSETRYLEMADRERGAHKRLARIMAKYPQFNAFVQTDPRGCALYIGKNLTDSNYNCGVAVYK